MEAVVEGQIDVLLRQLHDGRPILVERGEEGSNHGAEDEDRLPHLLVLLIRVMRSVFLDRDGRRQRGRVLLGNRQPLVADGDQDGSDDHAIRRQEEGHLVGVAIERDQGTSQSSSRGQWGEEGTSVHPLVEDGEAVIPEVQPILVESADQRLHGALEEAVADHDAEVGRDYPEEGAEAQHVVRRRQREAADQDGPPVADPVGQVAASRWPEVPVEQDEPAQEEGDGRSKAEALHVLLVEP